MKIKFVDLGFKEAVTLLALCVAALTILLAFSMAAHALPAIQKFGLRFLFTSTWDPVKEVFGALPFIYGTIISSLLALLIAVPVSLGVAIYLAELAPAWIREPLSFLIELLAAIPSVVYGLWGIFVLAPFLRQDVQPFLAKYFGFLPIFQGQFYGVGMLTAGIILSIMIIPTISSVSREVFLAVPSTQREAALALGATRWETIRLGVLKYTRPGILGAVILGLGRALGETMAVTMVIGNRPEISASLFAPAYTMASVIANEFSEATSNLYLSALIEIGLVLFFVTLLLNIAARVLIWQVSGKLKGEIKE
ncbi:MAG: phosphate ABC transporter permease subunit PstC [Candidatus Omnitrophica bacterium]|nr:phosphate ABC transporter permease subunit PstC [Candidatus Omnitrophota bacterium]